MLVASVNNKGSLYRLVMVKRCRKTVYFVNHFNAVGFVGSVSFSTLCNAYKYFKQFNSTLPTGRQDKKHKSITHQNQVALW